MSKRSLAFALGVAAGVYLSKQSRRISLLHKHVFISGGSRGLGLILAREFLARGTRVTITARDAGELALAEAELRELGEVRCVAADVTLREEAASAMEHASGAFGPVDILVNNAGVICVGPLEAMTIDDFRDSINTHFWAPYFLIEAALKTMRARRAGRIVNISSIGGKISIPHLLPYSVGKFALSGLSTGLRSELSKDNIVVTTVFPGLMRTGSPRNALFKGKNQEEYAWFKTGDTLPFLSMDANLAGRQIVEACRRGDAEIVLSLPAKIATRLYGLLPNETAAVLKAVNRFLPGPVPSTEPAKTGAQSDSELVPAWVAKVDGEAAKTNNEL